MALRILCLIGRVYAPLRRRLPVLSLLSNDKLRNVVEVENSRLPVACRCAALFENRGVFFECHLSHAISATCCLAIARACMRPSCSAVAFLFPIFYSSRLPNHPAGVSISDCQSLESRTRHPAMCVAWRLVAEMPICGKPCSSACFAEARRHCGHIMR